MKPISREFIKFVKKQISLLKTDEVINTMLNMQLDFENEILILSNRGNELKRQRIAGIISMDSYELSKNNINYSILSLLDEIANSIKKIHKTSFINFDNFEKDGFGEQWTHYKSESVVKDGVLIGKTIDIKDHAGVDAIRFEGRQDLEVSVKFNFVGETAERFNVWLDDKDYKGSHAGHICSITITPTLGSISDAKTGNFENAIYEKRTAGALDAATEEMLKAKTANLPLDLKREKWHTLLIQSKGDEVVVSVNGYELGKLKSEGLSHPTKSVVSLTTNINDVHYDDFVIRAAKVGKTAQ